MMSHRTTAICFHFNFIHPVYCVNFQFIYHVCWSIVQICYCCCFCYSFIGVGWAEWTNTHTQTHFQFGTVFKWFSNTIHAHTYIHSHQHWGVNIMILAIIISWEKKNNIKLWAENTKFRIWCYFYFSFILNKILHGIKLAGGRACVRSVTLPKQWLANGDRCHIIAS